MGRRVNLRPHSLKGTFNYSLPCQLFKGHLRTAQEDTAHGLTLYLTRSRKRDNTYEWCCWLKHGNSITLKDYQAHGRTLATSGSLSESGNTGNIGRGRLQKPLLLTSPVFQASPDQLLIIIAIREGIWGATMKLCRDSAGKAGVRARDRDPSTNTAIFLCTQHFSSVGTATYSSGAINILTWLCRAEENVARKGKGKRGRRGSYLYPYLDSIIRGWDNVHEEQSTLRPTGVCVVFEIFHEIGSRQEEGGNTEEEHRIGACERRSGNENERRFDSKRGGGARTPKEFSF
uniref:Uncharacterized protein n=1 Tax=Vespula pensylvanica TaxID=30213 RepID=A0A834PAE3_VESPE|nr:hypothetical protein H0235_002637 [Vespula pensylvanica]